MTRWGRRPSVVWDGVDDQENAEKYFARIKRRRITDAKELHLQLTLIGGSVLKITQLSPAELAARNLEAGLDNFYTKYNRGPYTVQLRDVATVTDASPLLGAYPYAVLDNEKRGVIAGSQEECEGFAEELNVEYAKHIMVKT